MGWNVVGVPERSAYAPEKFDVPAPMVARAAAGFADPISALPVVVESLRSVDWWLCAVGAKVEGVPVRSANAPEKLDEPAPMAVLAAAWVDAAKTARPIDDESLMSPLA